MIYIQGPSGPFFLLLFLKIHIKSESKYTEERRKSKYGLDSKKSKEEKIWQNHGLFIRVGIK